MNISAGVVIGAWRILKLIDMNEMKLKEKGNPEAHARTAYCNVVYNVPKVKNCVME